VIELRHLRYFVAVAETLNFSRAAERLHMAQPPLSLAIRQLEQELGTELFARTTREVKLTEAGRALLTGAGRVLTELDGAITAARRAAAGELGGLRVAFSWSARFETLPSLGQAFRARHPNVELLTEEMWNARMPDALRSGAVDIALSICPEVAGDLSYQLVRREAVVAMLPAGHRLAGEARIPLSALAEDELLLFPRDLAPHLHDFFVGLCRRAGYEPAIRQESFHSDWEIRSLADVAGVALIPESVARNLPAGVVAVPLSEPLDQLSTSLVWRTNVLAPAAAALRDLAPTLRF
jgi:DNA-binding transcriptional LysR family regulator